MPPRFLVSIPASGGWSWPVDIYCERTSAAFWAEPINAWTNLAFWLAAALAFAAWRRRGGRDGPALALIVVTMLVGVGSFLFHTVATRWAGLADVVPIAAFILGYVALATRRYLGFGLVGGLLALAVYLGAAWLITRTVVLPPGPLRGSLGYAPALLALVVMAGLVWLRAAHAAAWLANPKNRAYGAAGEAARWDEEEARVHKPRAVVRALLLAAALFALSLTFRSMDYRWCAVVPIGTHFLWHLLNGAVLYVLLMAAVRHGPARAAQGGGPMRSTTSAGTP